MSKLCQKIPAGYKQTEIGVIPEDWCFDKLKNLSRICTGSTPPTQDKSNYGNDYLFVSPADLGRSIYIRDTEKKLSKKGFALSRSFPQNSTLFTCIGSTIGKTGIAAIELTSNQQINAFFPSDKINWLYAYFILTYLSPKIKNLAGEQAVPQINKTQFENTEIYFPKSNKEQAIIATFLSDIDELVEILGKMIVKKTALKQGAMQQLLTGKNRLPGFDGKWNKKSLNEIGKTYGGISGKVKSDFGHGNAKYIPFLNIMNNPIIDVNNFENVDIKPNENQTKTKKGDLFFNGSSETPEEVGMCSVLKGDISNLYLNSFCFGFRLNRDLATDGLWLSYFFRSNAGRELIFSLAQGATRYNLSKTSFLKLEIPYPEPKEQTAIANVISDMDVEIEMLQKSRIKYRQIKIGMMQKLLTGKIRIYEPAK